MNIVCVAACTAGIAHTYIAREKLIKGASAGPQCQSRNPGNHWY